MAYATKEGVWLQRLLYELINHPLNNATHLSPKFTLEIDNQSCITLLKAPKHHENTKHIDYKYFYVKEMIEGTKEESQILVINYTPTTKQVTNFLTKALPKANFQYCANEIGMVHVKRKGECECKHFSQRWGECE